jgi:hypothetical protein
MKNNFHKILNELSYRVSTGIPDLRNEQHLMKLWDILKEHNWSVDARVKLLKRLDEQGKERLCPICEAQCQQGQNPGRDNCVAASGAKGTGKSAQGGEEEPEEEPTDKKVDEPELTPKQKKQLDNRFEYGDYQLEGMEPDEILEKISSKDAPAVEETTSRKELKKRAEQHRKDVFDGKVTGKGTKTTTIQEEMANIGREIAAETGFKEPPPLSEQIKERIKKDYPDSKVANDPKLLKLADKSDAGAKTMERLKNNPKWGYAEEQPEGHPIHTTDSLIVRDELITKLKQAEADGDTEAANHYRRELYFFQKKATDKSVTGKEGDADTMVIFTDVDGRSKVAYISNKQTILDQLNSATLNTTKESILENADKFFKDNKEKERGVKRINEIVDEQYKKASKFNETYCNGIRDIATDEEKRSKLREPAVSKAIGIAASVDQGASGKKKFSNEVDEDRSQKYKRDAQKSPEVQAQLLGDEPAPNNDPKSKEYKEWKRGITKKWENRDREYNAEETIQATIDATGTGNLTNVGTGSKAAPYTITRATIVTRDLRKRVQKLVDSGMSVKEACDQVSKSESDGEKLYNGKFSPEDVESIYNSDELKELEDAERQRGKDISGMYDGTTAKLKDEDSEWAKRNNVDDVPPKNGPYTKAYVQGWLNRTHLSDMIRGTFEGKSLMEIGGSTVSAPDFRRALAESTEFDGDPDDIEALEQHILDNVVPSQDGQNLIYVNKNNEEIIIGQDTHRTDGRSQKVVGQYSSQFGKSTLKFADENKGKK